MSVRLKVLLKHILEVYTNCSYTDTHVTYRHTRGHKHIHCTCIMSYTGTHKYIHCTCIMSYTGTHVTHCYTSHTQDHRCMLHTVSLQCLSNMGHTNI